MAATLNSHPDSEFAPLQAIVLANCLDETFHPISLESPKALLPLVNVPLIDYTLDWLESAGVGQVFVVCDDNRFTPIAHHLRNAGWLSKPKFNVLVVVSNNSSGGDVLGSPDLSKMIHGDFLLISGDIVSDMSLTKVLQEHKDRRKGNNFSLMTMVITGSDLCPFTHKYPSIGTDDLYIAIDPETKQLLYYNDKENYPKGHKCLLLELRSKYLRQRPRSPSPSLYSNKRDCHIDICSPEMLSLFPRHLDWQRYRPLFVKGMLEDGIMTHKIFTHELKSSYASKVNNFRDYDTISNYIIQRWRRPNGPDNPVEESACKLNRQEMYRVSEMIKTHAADIGDLAYCAIGKHTRIEDKGLLLYSVIGEGCVIGCDVSIDGCYLGNNVTIETNTRVLNSVIGEGCVLGSGVSVEGCYLWNNVTIEDGCNLRDALICDGVLLKSGAVLNPGVVLSFNVVVGQHIVVPAYSRVSLFPPFKKYSEEDLKYLEYLAQIIAFTPTTDESSKGFASLLRGLPSHLFEMGADGAGFIWSVGDEKYSSKQMGELEPPSPTDVAGYIWSLSQQ